MFHPDPLPQKNSCLSVALYTNELKVASISDRALLNALIVLRACSSVHFCVIRTARLLAILHADVFFAGLFQN